MIEKELEEERSHRLGACEKTLRKAMGKKWRKKKKKREWKFPTLKGKSKIKEGERLSSLERAKEVSIKKRHSIRQKSIPEKKYRVTNIVFW